MCSARRLTLSVERSKIRDGAALLASEAYRETREQLCLGLIAEWTSRAGSRAAQPLERAPQRVLGDTLDVGVGGAVDRFRGRVRVHRRHGTVLQDCLAWRPACTVCRTSSRPRGCDTPAAIKGYTAKSSSSSRGQPVRIRAFNCEAELTSAPVLSHMHRVRRAHPQWRWRLNWRFACGRAAMGIWSISVVSVWQSCHARAPCDGNGTVPCVVGSSKRSSGCLNSTRPCHSIRETPAPVVAHASRHFRCRRELFTQAAVSQVAVALIREFLFRRNYTDALKALDDALVRAFRRRAGWADAADRSSPSARSRHPLPSSPRSLAYRT
jgi:hypothetical protein